MVPLEEPAEPDRAPADLRIGIDFGTSTTQVAAYVPGREPQLLRLEDLTVHMPSYVAMGDGGARFGSVAMNLPDAIHSIKPLLIDDAELDGVGHPSKLAFLMLEEVVRRSLLRLREQRLIPETLETLEVATNLGCTPYFELDARVRLRDVAQRAGISVQLASLVEEPVAAAYEIMLSGLVSDGRALVVDMGGGTLDVAVLRISDAARKFELYATGATQRAGDRFTELVADRIRDEVRGLAPAVTLSRADETLIWTRADAAKQALSIRRSTVVPLGGIARLDETTFTLTRDWFEGATKGLLVRIKADVRDVFLRARLVLDRGLAFDPAPGTVDFEEREKGKVRRLTEVPFDVDGPAHVDTVVLVGGATNMPMIKGLFEGVFGANRIVEPELVDIDRSAIVALGLSRPKPKQMSNLAYPSWGVSAVFDPSPDGPLPLYEPYAPTFEFRRWGVTTTYEYHFDVPPRAQTVALAFRPVGEGEGSQWPPVELPPDASRLTFEMDLFGAVRLLCEDGTDLLAVQPTRPRTPWSPAESAMPPWLPPWKKPDWWTDMPMWDMRNDK
jgi:molecular chaperone DnaK (HSP70)